jgi:hypothetical protein
MTLKLTGAEDTTSIMKMGYWASLTFLQYINEQITHLSADLSTQIEFTKIAAIEGNTKHPVWHIPTYQDATLPFQFFLFPWPFLNCSTTAQRC